MIIENFKQQKNIFVDKKTELTKKPKISSSTKNAYFEKQLKKLPHKQDFLRSWCTGLDALVQNE